MAPVTHPTAVRGLLTVGECGVSRGHPVAGFAVLLGPFSGSSAAVFSRVGGVVVCVCVSPGRSARACAYRNAAGAHPGSRVSQERDPWERPWGWLEGCSAAARVVREVPAWGPRQVPLV